jgi:hypothetical protein
MSYEIRPVDVADIVKAVQKRLQDDVRINSASVKVERSADQNSDPNSCPWIGIYRSSVQYQQRQLVGVSGFQAQRVGLILLVAEADQGTPEACEDALEELVRNVLSALFTDTTLGNVVQNLQEVSVDYTSYDKTGGFYMQTAAIQFVAVCNTSITGG